MIRNWTPPLFFLLLAATLLAWAGCEQRAGVVKEKGANQQVISDSPPPSKQPAQTSPEEPAGLPDTHTAKPIASAEDDSSAEDASAVAQTEQPAELTAAAEPPADSINDDPTANTADVADGPLFEAWPKPVAVLVLSGSLQGYLEPCGCAGKENQKGGVARRHTLLSQLADQGWNVVPLDVGGQVKRYGRQAEIKFQNIADALKTMKYAGVGFGPDDLRLSVDELIAAAAPVGNAPSPFVSANVDLAGQAERFRVLDTGGHKIGFTSVLGDEHRQQVNNEGIEMRPAAEALSTVVPELEEAKCDLLVLLAHATLAESQELARKFPQFDLVVTTGGADEPPLQPESIEGSSRRLVEVGHKGMFVVAVGIYDDAAEPLRFQRIALDARFADSPAMLRVMRAYQDQLKQLGLGGLELRPTPHPSGRDFVGSDACAECHTQAYDVWKNTPHAHALDTLVNLDPQRHFDPECLSCHVTGWEPQRYFPFDGGYLSLDKTPLLAHNGCENCHGPGSQHVAAERDEIAVTDAQKTQLRHQMRLAKDKAVDNCLQCHDLDNSPEFKLGQNFDHYWKQVEHYGKD